MVFGDLPADGCLTKLKHTQEAILLQEVDIEPSLESQIN